MKLKETKIFLTEEEDAKLFEIAKIDGRNKTNFCTNEIRKIILKYQKNKKIFL